MPRALLAIVALAATVACSHSTPLAPSVSTPTLSGRVYGQDTDSESPLADAALTFATVGRSVATTSGADGFYSANLKPGTVQITASKAGYQTKTWTVDVVDAGVVLNISLSAE